MSPHLTSDIYITLNFRHFRVLAAVPSSYFFGGIEMKPQYCCLRFTTPHDDPNLGLFIISYLSVMVAMIIQTTSIAGSSPLSSPSPSPPPSLPSDFDASALLESPPLTMVPASPNPLAKAATSRRPEITASPTPVHLHKRVPSTNSTHVPSSSIHNHRNPPQTSVDRSLGRRRFEPYSPPTRRNADLMDNSPHSAHLGDEQNTDSYRTPINLQTYRQREFYPSRWQDWDWSCLVQRCGPTPPDRPDSPERQGQEEYPLHSQRPRAVERAERGGGCVQDGPSQEEQVAVYSLMMIGR
ncbi:hypothetical protein BDN72DRAFT_285517 [Pluteus cervinus]|uniref:Uncharacterized protein n=1 Tax=Pluteus cervinus TaxID=181527 RepID=A0ACD3AEJ6_9AGAR|nr:hypothetical protein BDN72DRAFT_285517 [Pluteus cervinus]